MEWKQASAMEGLEIVEQALGQLEAEADNTEAEARNRAMACVCHALRTSPEGLTEAQRNFLEAYIARSSRAPQEPYTGHNWKIEFEHRKPEVP